MIDKDIFLLNEETKNMSLNQVDNSEKLLSGFIQLWEGIIFIQLSVYFYNNYYNSQYRTYLRYINCFTGSWFVTASLTTLTSPNIHYFVNLDETQFFYQKIGLLFGFFLFIFIDKNFLSENDNIDSISINTLLSSKKNSDPSRTSTILEIEDMNDKLEKKQNDKESLKDESFEDKNLLNKNKTLNEILIDRQTFFDENVAPVREFGKSLNINPDIFNRLTPNDYIELQTLSEEISISSKTSSFQNQSEKHTPHYRLYQPIYLKERISHIKHHNLNQQNKQVELEDMFSEKDLQLYNKNHKKKSEPSGM